MTHEPGQGPVKAAEAKDRVAQWFDDAKHKGAKGSEKDRETIDDALEEAKPEGGDETPET